ncbi:hypothetical protein TIFTF001_016482 [Ficus carica]|uniref:Uncharacterized protein n=1 Tax=Ficus carica TaxID=3494 RepID=A0AA88D7G5_FICCA|nr:hypothetical protein TIFTF001_016482 [Ficus carica]
MNLKHNKKEKSITSQVEVQNFTDDDDVNDNKDLTETLTSLTQNFNKKMNRKIDKSNNFQKSKAAASLFESKKKSKGIQFRSQEYDEDQVSNHVAFNIVTDRNAAKNYVVVTKAVVTPAGIVETVSDEDIQRAYKEMYSKGIQVCKINKTLEIHVDELCKEKDVLKRAVINYEFLTAEKERKLQETIHELENMQKSLKMLNSGTANLDHILSIGKAS